MEYQHLFTWRVPLVVLALSAACYGCASTPSMMSQRSVQPFTVDGNTEDWSGVLKPVDEQRFSLGVSNDDEFLYISVMTRDQNVSTQIIQSGLIIWLSASGEKDKRFGIKYPIGLRELGIGRQGVAQPAGPARQRNASEMERNFRMSLSELEIGSNDKRWDRVPVAGAHGIKVSARYEFGTLSYELKVPLEMDSRFAYALGASAGNSIMLGIETPDLDRVPLGPSTRPDAGGFGAAGVGGGLDDGGGEERRRSSRRIEPVRYWVNIGLQE